MSLRISALTRSLFFSFMSYLFVLFVIIVIDTFIRRDFDFARAAAISAMYIAALLLLFAVIVWSIRFRLNLKQHLK
jgi:hypothetical protein